MNSEAPIDEIVRRVRAVAGVRAIVLGGSRARGTHTATSDTDLGLYYDPDRPLDLAALDEVAAELDDRRRSGLVTPVGGWGPWVNGGGWLTVQSHAVDFIYRDLRQVAGVIDACRRGEVGIVYQPGHPHGFVSSIYLAEIATCRPLWEADGEITALQRLASPYPAALRSALIGKFGWEVRFALETARKCIDRADVVYAAGATFRAAICLLQVLFALNEQPWLNEKGAVAMAESFPRRPPRLRARLEAAFTRLAADGDAIRAAIDDLDALEGDLAALIAER